MKLIYVACFCLLFSLQAYASETYDKNPKAQKLTQELVREDQLDKKKLEAIFASIKKDKKVLRLMTGSPENKADWKRYSGIFLNDKRIKKGKAFLKKEKVQLDKATAKYGVPKNVIAAILGIETHYGEQTGGHSVVRSLATLAFEHPRRHRFFRSELKHFLRIAHEQNRNALELTGSYAGAMGYPQFMPSSYVSYAVDFDGDGDINIWQDSVDAIGSIANYLSRFGWKKGLPIGYRVHPSNTQAFIKLANNNLKPAFTSQQLDATGVASSLYPTVNKKYSLLVLTGVQPQEYWIGTKNFYVISRYNHSHLYTMAVLRLAQLIDPLAQ